MARACQRSETGAGAQLLIMLHFALLCKAKFAHAEQMHLDASIPFAKAAGASGAACSCRWLPVTCDSFVQPAPTFAARRPLAFDQAGGFEAAAGGKSGGKHDVFQAGPPSVRCPAAVMPSPHPGKRPVRASDAAEDAVCAAVLAMPPSRARKGVAASGPVVHHHEQLTEHDACIVFRCMLRVTGVEFMENCLR